MTTTKELSDYTLYHQDLSLFIFDRNEFAYASSDKLVYIRQFSDRGAEMTLSAVLQGHEAEVTQVRLHSQFPLCSEIRISR